MQKLALDETDAIFGAFEPRFLGYAADAGSWSPLPGGFSRWLERYHRVALHGSRPVLVTVHVRVCGVVVVAAFNAQQTLLPDFLLHTRLLTSANMCACLSFMVCPSTSACTTTLLAAMSSPRASTRNTIPVNTIHMLPPVVVGKV